MELNLGRFGPFLSDRLILGRDHTVDGLCVDNTIVSWASRFISLVTPCEEFSDTNRRTIACVKRHFIDQLGLRRFNRICDRYELNLRKMQLEGTSFLARDLAKILMGAADVKVDDIEDLIIKAKLPLDQWPNWIDQEFREILQGVQNSNQLELSDFDRVVKALAAPPVAHTVPAIRRAMTGMKPTEELACFFFDPFLADRERHELSKENREDTFETFAHNFVGRICGREMIVGMLIPAPDHPDGSAQYYRVDAKIVTGEGMVSYCLTPATTGTNLKPVRFFRGTAFRPSALDGASSLITDLERKLGATAHDSGKIYRRILHHELGPIPIGVGHSLGSTLLQYDMIENDEYDEVYLFMGPGLSEEDVDAFNERMGAPGAKNLTMHIRDANTDILSTNGKINLGYEAPPNVTVDYLKYFPLRGVGRGRAHVAVFHREDRFYGIQGVRDQAEIDIHLNREELLDSSEALRCTIGPCIARIIRLARDFFRWLFASRTFIERGLHIGKFVDGRWTVQHLDYEQVLEKDDELEALERAQQRLARLIPGERLDARRGGRPGGGPAVVPILEVELEVDPVAIVPLYPNLAEELVEQDIELDAALKGAPDRLDEIARNLFAPFNEAEKVD